MNPEEKKELLSCEMRETYLDFVMSFQKKYGLTIDEAVEYNLLDFSLLPGYRIMKEEENGNDHRKGIK